MSDQTENLEEKEVTEVDLEAQRDALLERAKTLGIKVSGNIGIDTLRERIREHLELKEDKKEETEDNSVETFNEARARIRAEQTALIRVRLTNMNQEKKELNGEIFTVVNKYVGTVRKFIPYNSEPYHIPKILLDLLREKEFSQKFTTKVDGREVNQTKWVKEFAIEVLPPLTKEELKQLATSQLAKGI